jgi:uncharacterized protein involved in type VI secretion and phage assembly
MSSNDFFSHILDSEGRLQSEAPIVGLAFAEVHALNDDGTYDLIYQTRDSTEPTGPARLATLMAGDKRGTFFRPEKGDEVVVGFINGNINTPVILGALWSDKDHPPEGADTEKSNNTRMIVSRLKHKIVFDDSSNGKITIKSAGGISIELDDTSSAPKLTLKTAAGMTMVLEDTPGAAKIEAQTAGGLKLVLDDTAKSITLTTTGTVATSQIKFDGVSWNHQHATGTGPSGPPVSISS